MRGKDLKGNKVKDGIRYKKEDRRGVVFEALRQEKPF